MPVRCGKRCRDVTAAVFFFVALVAFPLAGVVLDGQQLSRYLEFPPVTRYVEHAGFSWPVFGVVAGIIVAVVLTFDVRVFRQRQKEKALRGSARRFPWWGWLGVLTGSVAWVLAWSRFSWFAPLQRFTFSPLWFSYIVVVNALTWRRTGHCMLKDRPRFFLLLFPVSAAFWWAFEYLNRFVQNWYYVGAAGLTAWQYFLFATLPFSTVLPAVLGTFELLRSVPRAGAGLESFLPVSIGKPRTAAVAVLAASCLGMAGIGVWPDILFPLLWVSPLFVLTALQVLRGRTTVFSRITRGDWRYVYLAAMAALICGGFWEMWNACSFAQWRYAIPYVGRFRIFEMPVLGYAGYLPFGLECAVVGDLLASLVSRDASAAYRPEKS